MRLQEFADLVDRGEGVQASDEHSLWWGRRFGSGRRGVPLSSARPTMITALTSYSTSYSVGRIFAPPRPRFQSSVRSRGSVALIASPSEIPSNRLTNPFFALAISEMIK